jgi:hypothetical protein
VAQFEYGPSCFGNAIAARCGLAIRKVFWCAPVLVQGAQAPRTAFEDLTRILDGTLMTRFAIILAAFGIFGGAALA